MNRTVIRQPKADKLYHIALTGEELTIIRYALSLAHTHAMESARVCKAPSDKLLNRKTADVLAEIEASIRQQMQSNN